MRKTRKEKNKFTATQKVAVNLGVTIKLGKKSNIVALNLPMRWGVRHRYICIQGC